MSAQGLEIFELRFQLSDFSFRVSGSLPQGECGSARDSGEDENGNGDDYDNGDDYEAEEMDELDDDSNSILFSPFLWNEFQIL